MSKREYVSDFGIAHNVNTIKTTKPKWKSNANYSFFFCLAHNVGTTQRTHRIERIFCGIVFMMELHFLKRKQL